MKYLPTILHWSCFQLAVSALLAAASVEPSNPKPKPLLWPEPKGHSTPRGAPAAANAWIAARLAH